MKIQTKLKVEVYHCSVTFIITDEMNSTYKKLCKKLKIQEEEGGESEGLVIYSGNDITSYYLLIDLKYLSHNTIAHEVYHLVDAIAHPRSVNEEESKAWLCGYISAFIYRFLDKKKLEIKHV